MTPCRLAAYRSERYPVSQANLSVVGDVDPARVSQLVRERLGKLPHAPAPRIVPPQEEPISAPRAAVRKLDKAQSHLVIGFPGARLSDPLRWELELLSAILAGQGGRLFLELRDKRSPRYGVRRVPCD